METKFNFKSQVCTDRFQSERLLALGLKKETADCYWFYCDIAKEWKCTILSSTQVFKDYPTTVIPSWSMHRLIEMMPKSIHFENEDWYKIIYNNSVCYQRGQFSICRSCKGDLYEDVANCISWLIKEGYFNKEYLV